MNLLLRLFAYISIFAAYILFMHTYAPMGVYWQDFHAQRIFNAVEFLKLNGYFSTYGFTIWDSCANCALNAEEWQDKIYFSVHALTLLPYISFNHWGGRESLEFLGPLLDQGIVLFCGILIAELFLKAIKDFATVPGYLACWICFAFFALSPWTYKMIQAAWMEIYFLMFFLSGFLAFVKKKSTLGYVLFFLAGIAHYQWAFAVGMFYIAIAIATYILNSDKSEDKYFPQHQYLNLPRAKVIFSLLLPVVLFLLWKMIAQQYISGGDGSSILYRIGISGNDIHNGGLLGSLQFLAGTRINSCLGDFSAQDLSGGLLAKIAMYNCILSLASMAMISLASVAGMYLLIKSSSLGKKLIPPLAFGMLFFIAFFQQSLSVHLMGYSFIFAAIFASGLTYLLLAISSRLDSPILGLVFLFPVVSGICILMIRVSMLAVYV